jgi:hypothetical protein
MIPDLFYDFETVQIPSCLSHRRLFIQLQPLSPMQTFLEDQRDVTESKQYGDFDERTDGRC